MKKLSKVGFLALFIGLFITYSCKKKELVFVIEGQIFDKSFNQNLSQGTVKLYRVPVATTNEIFVDEQTVTDGKYSFTFPRDKSERYVIKFSKDGYFDETHEVYFSQLQVGTNYILNFNAEAIATMNWIFLDGSPQNSNYFVTLQKLNGRPIGVGTCPNQSYDVYGGSPPDTMRCAVGGNQYVKFYVLRPPDILLDSVFCPAFEDVYYTILF